MDDGESIGIEASPARLAVHDVDDAFSRREDRPGNAILGKGLMQGVEIRGRDPSVGVLGVIAKHVCAPVDEGPYFGEYQIAAEIIVVEDRLLAQL